jgi:hypothetical protein
LNSRPFPSLSSSWKINQKLIEIYFLNLRRDPLLSVVLCFVVQTTSVKWLCPFKTKTYCEILVFNFLMRICESFMFWGYKSLNGIVSIIVDNGCIVFMRWLRLELPWILALFSIVQMTCFYPFLCNENWFYVSWKSLPFHKLKQDRKKFFNIETENDTKVYWRNNNHHSKIQESSKICIFTKNCQFIN